MTTPQIAAVALVAFCLFVLAAYRLSVWIDLRRQRDQQAALDTVVREERRLSLVLDDPTDEPLEVDPPAARLYIAPLDTARSMEPLPPLPPIGGVWS